MRGRSIRTAVIIAAIGMHVGAGSVWAAPVTYNYVGNNFNFCGFGCPENLPPGVTVTPVDGEEVDISDYIIASLTFADALPFNPGDPNHEYTQSELPDILAWSMGDASGAIAVSGTTFGPFPDFFDEGQFNPIPPLTLTTDVNGNIVNYVMAVHVLPHILLIANPGFAESDSVLISDVITAFYAPDPGGSEELEWDVFGTTPGQWTRVVTEPQPIPEPGTLFLFGAGVAAAGGYRRRRAAK